MLSLIDDTLTLLFLMGGLWLLHNEFSKLWAILKDRNQK